MCIRDRNQGEEFLEETGELVGVWTEGTTTNVTGGGTGSYAGGVGACIGWSTAGIHNGRKVRGRTFVVPLAANQYDTDGTVASGVISTLDAAAATLIGTGTGRLSIWARPTPTVPGMVYAATSGTVKDHVSWLRSRR